MAADRRAGLLVLTVAMALSGCGKAPPATTPSDAAVAARATAESPPDLQALLRRADQERAVVLRVRGTLEVLPGGAPRDVDLWLARSGAMRMELGDGIVSICDGATLWTLRDGEVSSATANRAPYGSDLTSLVAPFDLVEGLLPAPFTSVDERLAIDRTADAVRLMRLCSDCVPTQPVRVVTLTPDASAVVRRQRYDDLGELLRIDVISARELQWQRRGQQLTLRLVIEALERDPQVPVGTFRPPR